ncbi:MAG TPA: glycosyltransferase family 39 protein [Solirubrobacteraceae bacterium]|jgi:predicted membrane-bound dolichyl-phosphate-mannose-protein mannosyltransferase
MVRRALSSAKTPLLLLAVVSVLSLAARAFMLDEPCQSPCTKAGQHTLIFDEAYYVNAARVIASLRPPPGVHYADAPSGVDPNAEHPQGAKLIMAAAIELFGDGPFAWRIGSVLFGTVAILGMFALVRAAGGGRWTALGAATLMSCDNLLLVHGRIGTLDIYVVAMMIWGMAAYARGRPLLAGLVLAVASAFKLVAPYLALSLLLLELIRVITARRERGSPPQWQLRAAVRRLVSCIGVGVAAFMGILAVMDRIATPYDDANAKLITGGPFAHLAHMISYAAQQTSPRGLTGIASYPWQWLLDMESITYLRINPSLPGDGLFAIHPVSKFLGLISPPIMVLALPALAFALYRFVKLPRVGRAAAAVGAGVGAMPAVLAGGGGDPPAFGSAGRGGGAAASGIAGSSAAAAPGTSRLAADQVNLAAVGFAWALGTWIPFAVLSLLDQRTSYIYYMVVVMPGIYVAISYLLSCVWRRGHRAAYAVVAIFAVTVLAAAVLMYPFVPVF